MNIGEYFPRQSQDKYLPMFTEPEANRSEHQELQNNGLKHRKLNTSSSSLRIIIFGHSI